MIFVGVEDVVSNFDIFFYFFNIYNFFILVIVIFKNVGYYLEWGIIGFICRDCFFSVFFKYIIFND